MDGPASRAEDESGPVLGYPIVFSRTDTLGWRATCPDFATVLAEGTTREEAAGVAEATVIALIEMNVLIGVPVPPPRHDLSPATGLFLPTWLAESVTRHNDTLAADALAARWQHVRGA